MSETKHTPKSAFDTDLFRELLSVLKRLADYAFDTSEYLPEKREDIERAVNAVIAKAEGRQ